MRKITLPNHDPDSWPGLEACLQNLVLSPTLDDFLDLIQGNLEEGNTALCKEVLLEEKEKDLLIPFICKSALKVPEKWKSCLSQLGSRSDQRRRNDDSVSLSLEEQLFLLSHMLLCTIR